jgi:hypothetical protein
MKRSRQYLRNQFNFAGKEITLMKTSLYFISVCILSGVLSGCGDSTSDRAGTTQIGTVTMNVDNKVITLKPEDDVISMSYVGGDHLLFSVLSESNDLQFAISAYSKSLDKKSLQVYDCGGPSLCEGDLDENQFVMLAPYIKDPLPPVSDSRVAYNAPDLGVAPLTLTITEILDEQLEGVIYPTKRVKGNFNGTLVYTEQVDDQWVVKSSTKVDGTFDMFCTIQ